MELRDFAKLPTKWIEDGGLRQFRWGGSSLGANNTAALMALLVISQHADPVTGISRLTYDQMCAIAGLSRAKLSGGLSVLDGLNIIDRSKLGKSNQSLVGYNPHKGWGMVPTKGLYKDGKVQVFSRFHLRNKAELNALKLYFLFISRRDRDTNMAHLTYNTIERYSGMERGQIKQGLSVLAVLGLVHIETLPALVHDVITISNAYRIAHIKPYTHRGTLGHNLPLLDLTEPHGF
jgi:hypothetical protein